MSLPIRRTSRFLKDVVEVATYLGEEAGWSTADRFVEASEAALANLADMPGTGATWESPLPQLREVRVWQIPGFPNYLLFYRAAGDVLEALRVLYGGRDLSGDIRTI